MNRVYAPGEDLEKLHRPILVHFPQIDRAQTVKRLARR